MQAQYTPNQILEALRANDWRRIRVAEALGISLRSVERACAILKARGEQVLRPEMQLPLTSIENAHEAAPAFYRTKGVSSLVDGEGNVKLQWIKTDQDAEDRLNALKAAVEALMVPLVPQPATPLPATPGRKCLLNLYTITDYHIGMLAWRREGGADWDLTIAEDTLVACFSEMIRRSPDAAIAVLNQLGDFLHFDGLEAVTPTSEHNLDTDSRFQKIVEVAVRVLRRVVVMLLTKHERVHVIMAEGNHDIASSVWLRVLFREVFRDEPRITVEMSPLPYYAYQHGKTMLAFHHGHLTKKEKIGGKIPAQFPKMWGATEYRYCHLGHLHSEWVKEEDGIKVMQHPTMAARDAYAARGAWYASRAAKCITYHEEFGELGSVTVTPEMI